MLNVLDYDFALRLRDILYIKVLQVNVHHIIEIIFSY